MTPGRAGAAIAVLVLAIAAGHPPAAAQPGSPTPVQSESLQSAPSSVLPTDPRLGVGLVPPVASAGAPSPVSQPAEPSASEPVRELPLPIPGLPRQEAFVGDLELEMGRPLLLKLGIATAASLWQSADAVAHALAPAVPEPPSTAAVPDVTVTLHWQDPLVGETTLAITAGEVEIDIPPGPARTILYDLTLRAPDGRYEMRLPASPGRFTARVSRPQPASVLHATGTVEQLIFGGSVPVEMQIYAPEGVRQVVIHHRSQESDEFAAATMQREGDDPRNALWKISLPRPLGLDAYVEYFAEIHNTSGEVSFYGTREQPHRVTLRDPTEAR